ncbi:NAD(P)-dependent oxidoreductase [Desulfovibrio litoralis]|uniref:3-hydroxyisobutyrate dehydrogenase n=1 Tax=Desulfovibrio litoralis DSM 11393 TaxID=1121455 RepID=A0A1M7T3S3_9BACT|nr:NAD(P)-dependent oxidoreductase [Desulfovibrio litoralis]SHN65359.1 3-hydroxyisobutyrate dehydrogenase [Desulfovibrio litoralis DSM 11393]
MKIGFIGAGLMGGPLARNLIRAGKDVLVFDLSKEAIDRTLAAGKTGKAAASVNDMAGCDVVFTSLPLPQHINGTMLGDKGVYSFLKKGAVHIELSTIDPTTANGLAKAAAEKGIKYLQCTLGKTPAHAEKAEEPMFVGGDKAAYDALGEAFFKIFGIPFFVGSIDASCAVKLISNMVGMTNLAVLAEGIKAGQKAGLDTKLLLELLTDTGARSFQMDVRGPWIANNDFDARFGLDLALKDVRLGCEMTRSFGLNLTIIESALALYKEASAAGFGKEDCNAVYKSVK